MVGRIRVTVILTVLGLTGCAGDTYIPTDGMMGAAKSLGGYTRDASVAKELAVHETLRNRDRMIRDTHAQSGLKLEWQIVEETVRVPGQDTVIKVSRPYPKITYTEPADFKQRLPDKPSVHPAWQTVENVGKSIVNGVILYKGVEETGKTIRHSLDSASPKYGGGQYNDSYNTDIYGDPNGETK